MAVPRVLWLRLTRYLILGGVTTMMMSDASVQAIHSRGWQNSQHKMLVQCDTQSRNGPLI